MKTKLKLWIKCLNAFLHLQSTGGPKICFLPMSIICWLTWPEKAGQELATPVIGSWNFSRKDGGAKKRREGDSGRPWFSNTGSVSWIFCDFLCNLVGGGVGGAYFKKQLCRTDKSLKKNVRTREIMEEKARDVKKLVSEVANWSRLLLFKNAINWSFELRITISDREKKYKGIIKPFPPVLYLIYLSTALHSPVAGVFSEK